MLAREVNLKALSALACEPQHLILKLLIIFAERPVSKICAESDANRHVFVADASHKGMATRLQQRYSECTTEAVLGCVAGSHLSASCRAVRLRQESSQSPWAVAVYHACTPLGPAPAVCRSVGTELSSVRAGTAGHYKSLRTRSPAQGARVHLPRLSICSSPNTAPSTQTFLCKLEKLGEVDVISTSPLRIIKMWLHSSPAAANRTWRLDSLQRVITAFSL